MKVVLAGLAVVLVISGCSRSSAFTHFTKLDSAQERAVSSLQTGSIKTDQYRKAIISTVYLNQVEPKTYTENETFFIALYLRGGETLQLQDDDSSHAIYQLSLNGTAPLNTTAIEEGDPLRRLMPISNDWNYFYTVEFPHHDENNLTLTLENDQFESVSLTYQKDDL